MSHPSPSVDPSWFIWALGGLAFVFAGVARWFSGRLDKKLSIDVFEQFKESNTKDHESQDGKLDKIFDKLDGKQDKWGP